MRFIVSRCQELASVALQRHREDDVVLFAKVLIRSGIEFMQYFADKRFPHVADLCLN